MSERFPFQIEGADFLSKNPRALLADEQGLGKTVQAIDAADKLGADRILVLCKAVAKINWMREFEKWSVQKSIYQLPRTTDCIVKRHEAHPTRVIINYDIVHHPKILGQLIRNRWDVLICDEMQMLKSGVYSRRGQAVLDPARGIYQTAECVWGLSGTPAPSHAGDLYAWLAALRPEIFRQLNIYSYEQFLDRFTYYEDTPYGPRIKGNRDPQILRELIRPTLLRRRRKNVLPQLPKMLIDTIPVEGRTLPDLRALESHPDVQAVRSVIAALDPEENPEDFLATAELPWPTIRRLIGLAKVQAVAELVAEELDNGVDKIVVMAWHTDVIDALVQLLKPYQAVGLHGKMPGRQKPVVVDRFQNEPNVRVFVGQIQTAGTSITLTAAARLFFAEYSTVPGDNEQALLRILRIGQTRGCRASFVSLHDSLDEVITRIYANRVEMLEEFLD